MNFRNQIFSATALIVILLHWSGAGQTPFPLESTTSNSSPVAPPPLIIETPITNEVILVTNQIPVIKPISGKSHSSNLLNSFSGNFGSTYSISGRTLKFPVPQPTARPATSWQRSLDFGMDMSRGNSDTLRYSLGLDAMKEANANKIRLRAHGAYGESDGTKDTENAAATLRYDRQLTPLVYALGNLTWTTDPIADLDYRFTGILSPGLHLVRTRTALLNAELGAGYVEEKKDKNEDGYTAGRAALTAEKLINEHVLIWASTEFIPKLADPSIFFINSEIGLGAYITRDLSLDVCYQNRYDSNPAEDVESSDTILSTALSLSF